MWVRLWAGVNCASGHESREHTYTWVSDDDATDEVLEDYAEEFRSGIPWIAQSDRSVYGFDRIGPVLPLDVAKNKIAKYQQQIAALQRSIDFIKSQYAEPAPRFDRDPFQDPDGDVKEA